MPIEIGTVNFFYVLMPITIGTAVGKKTPKKCNFKTLKSTTINP